MKWKLLSFNQKGTSAEWIISTEKCSFTHYFISILWKMAVFSEKSPVTSSNCYNTTKTASILIKLGTNVIWTIAFVTRYSGLNFLYHGNEGTSQNCQKSLFCIDFFHQNWFQSVATSQWIEIESDAFQRWLHVTIWSIWGHF
jgi:hypothetical protein